MIKSKTGTREEDRQTEDEIARKRLGPRGVPGAPDTARMTPQEGKNIPMSGEFDGHTRSNSFWLAESPKRPGASKRVGSASPPAPPNCPRFFEFPRNHSTVGN